MVNGKNHLLYWFTDFRKALSIVSVISDKDCEF